MIPAWRRTIDRTGAAHVLHASPWRGVDAEIFLHLQRSWLLNVEPDIHAAEIVEPPCRGVEVAAVSILAEVHDVDEVENRWAATSVR